VEVGKHFEQLGLSKADIYNSPMLRTAQTAAYMFNKVGTGEDWLISCKGTMLRDALAHKGRTQPDPGDPQRMHGAARERPQVVRLHSRLWRFVVRFRRNPTDTSHARLHRRLGLAIGDE
jgi:hypothetical protein